MARSEVGIAAELNGLGWAEFAKPNIVEVLSYTLGFASLSANLLSSGSNNRHIASVTPALLLYIMRGQMARAR